MLKRVISGLILGSIAFAVIYFGGIVIDIAGVVFAALALYEIYKTFKAKGHNLIPGAAVILLLIMVSNVFTDRTGPAAVYFRFSENLNIFSVLFLAAFLYILAAIVNRHDKYTVVDGALTLFGGLFCIFLLNYFILLRNLEAGAYMLILAIVGCIGADSAAFFVGCKFGKKKLIPEISPKKTVEGSIAAFAGGIIACTAYGAFLLYVVGVFKQFPIYHYVIIGLILSVVAQIGDLCASAMKRYCEVKDFGNMLPGHGGLIDRFDAYLLAVPVVYYYYVAFLLAHY